MFTVTNQVFCCSEKKSGYIEEAKKSNLASFVWLNGCVNIELTEFEPIREDTSVHNRQKRGKKIGVSERMAAWLTRAPESRTTQKQPASFRVLFRILVLFTTPKWAFVPHALHVTSRFNLTSLKTQQKNLQHRFEFTWRVFCFKHFFSLRKSVCLFVKVNHLPTRPLKQCFRF